MMRMARVDHEELRNGAKFVAAYEHFVATACYPQITQIEAETLWRINKEQPLWPAFLQSV